MIKNKYLFAFENDEFMVVETKLLDMPEGAAPSDVYFWLLINKNENSCKHLTFKSMKKEPIQIREFEEGYLEFTNDTAKFNDINLNKVDLNEISDKIKKTIISFFEKKNKNTYKLR